MVKEAKPLVASHPGGGNQLNAGSDLRAPARVSGRKSPLPGGCGGNADRIIEEVRNGLESLRLEIQAAAREQQKHMTDELDVLREELAGEVHPEIQDLEDEVDEDVSRETEE